MRIKEVMLFSNGQVAVFDENNQQVGPLQIHNVIELFAEYAAGSGYEMDGCRFSTQKPAGDGCCGTIQKYRDGFAAQWDKA